MQQFIGLRFGKPELDGITIVGCSLAADDIALSLDDSSETNVSINEIGTDNSPTQDRAGYVGNNSISGLLPYTKYNYTATQGANSVSGYFWTAPREADDFILIPITCDNNNSIGGVPAGGYSHARKIAEANPDKGVYFVHIDDHYGYSDLNQVNEGAFGSGHAVTGTNAQQNALVYDYALSYFASFGLYSDQGNEYCTWGQDEDRIWCMRNIPVLPQWGDHDTGQNEMGWLLSPSDLTGSPSPNTKFTNATSVWNEFLKPLQGDNISVGTNAWSHKLGCVKIIAPDGITNGSGDGSATTKPTTVYGATQPADIIAACDDTSVPFKIPVMNYGIRYLTPNASTFQDGAQNPLGGNESHASPIAAHPEYEEIFTNNGGLMSLPSCNGEQGVLMTVHGDYHAATVVRHQNSAGVHEEGFTSVNVGTINGSVNFEANHINVGDVQDGSTVELAESTYLNHDWWVVPFFVYGSRKLKEIEIHFHDRTESIIWDGKLTEKRGGNFANRIDSDLVVDSSGGGSGI